MYFKVWLVEEWTSTEQCYNDTERGNWSIGRKKLYSVRDKWMNVYGAVVEDTEWGKFK